MAKVTTEWSTVANGATTAFDLTGKYLLTAKIQWRRANIISDIQQTAENQSATFTNGSKTVAMPAMPENALLVKQVVSARGSREAGGNPAASITLCANFPGGNTTCSSWTGTTSSFVNHERDRITYGTGNAGGSASQSTTYFLCRVLTRTIYRHILITQNPRATVNGEISQVSGTVPEADTNLITLLGLTSNAVNTISHGCTAYSDELDGASGQLQFRIEYEFVTAPTLTTLDATNVGPTSARLNGNLISTGGAPTTRYFEYGETTAYGAVVNAGIGGVAAYSFDQFDLLTNTTYNYRAYAIASIASPYHSSTWTLRTNGANLTFQTQAAAPTVQTLTPSNLSYVSTTFRGNIIAINGIIPERFFEYGKTVALELGSVSAGLGDAGEYTYNIAGLNYDTLHYVKAYGVNDAGQGDGAVLTFSTLYPYLPAPTNRAPDNAVKTDNDKPTFTFTLGGGDVQLINPALKYHARIRFSEYVGMTPLMRTLETTVSRAGWEFYDGAAWQAYPAEGVNPGTIVRITPTVGLPFGPVYWDCAAYDGLRYGWNSSVRVIRILLTVEGAYTLSIGGNVWEVYNDLNVIETANGEMGTITFSVKRDNLRPIAMGDQVVLALRDWQAQTEEFVGRVRRLNPVGSMISVVSILGDGYLSERRVKTDYPTNAVAETITAFEDNLDSKTKVTSTAHSLIDGDKVLIECDVNDYNGVWTVEQKAVNTYVINVAYVSAGTGTGKPIADIGTYVASMINTYCAPVTANDGNTYVTTATGFIAPIKAMDKTVVRVMEEIRRNYGYYYFVDRDNQAHFYPPTDVIAPSADVILRRGEPA